MTINVCFITMGCAKNEVDTTHMKRCVLDAGFCVTDDVEVADVVVVNTCSFIEAATKESLEVIFDVVQLPEYARGKIKLVVAGCMPARYKKDLQTDLREASAFVSCDEEKNIAKIIADLFEIDAQNKSALDDKNASSSNALHENTKGSNALHANTSYEYIPSAGPYSSYVKISDGCDRFCSYCTIPYIRGRYHSFSYEDICAEIDDAQSAGVVEVVLIAQDTGRWGSDFDVPLTLSWLLDNLATRYPKMLFRVMYLQPEAIDDELLDVMCAHENIIKYLDIPLQHVNPRLLKEMNRKGSRKEFEKLVAHIKEKVPHITLRTTLIAGFPGESDAEFEELCDFCEMGLFDYVGVFAYSREEGTRAYDLPNQLDDVEKQHRAQRLSDIANSVCTSSLNSKIGDVVSVILEGVDEDGHLFGRSLFQAPEVDGITYVDAGSPGEIVKAKIVDSLFFDVEAEAI